ncbi:MAG: histidine phosphatase family protein [Planctomycetes bacterium]|nr:histidine phosphatase family protein [Planctomycetota bacterium]
MILYLIRHGESAFNAEGRIQGQLDVPLSELGHQQARAVAAEFQGREIQALYASPLRRAYDTARPVAAALGLPIVADERLRELNAGVFQGLLWSEIAERFPAAGQAWRSQQPDYRIPQGESRRDLMQRGSAALEAIRETGYEAVVVVAHGGILTAAIKACLEVPAERNPFMLYNGSISMVEWGVQFRLMTLNQMDHLQRAGADLRSRTGDL